MTNRMIELGSLTHGSYFRFVEDGVPWVVRRHTEDYTVAEAFGDQEFPTQQLVYSRVDVYVSPFLPWRDARRYGAYTIQPQEGDNG